MAAGAAGLCALPGCGLLDPLPSLSGSVARALAGGVFAAFTTSERVAATWIVRHVLHLLTPGTEVRLGSGTWFATTIRQVLPLVGYVVLPLALAGTITAVARQDLRRLARVWLVGVPVGVGAGGILYALVAVSVGAVDELCGLLHPAAAIVAVSGAAGVDLAGTPEGVQALVGLLLLVAGVCLWLELVLRSASVYLALFFMPLVLATLLWPTVAGAAKRFVELLAALVLAKLVIVGALCVGAGALDATHGGIDTAISGAAVLLLAAFAPFAVLRLVPFVEVGAVAHLEGLSRRPVLAAEAVPQRVAAHASRAGALLGQLHRPPSGGLEASPSPRLPLPEHRTDWTLPPDPHGGEGAGRSPGGGDPPTPGPGGASGPGRLPAGGPWPADPGGAGGAPPPSGGGR